MSYIEEDRVNLRILSETESPIVFEVDNVRILQVRPS